MFYAIYDHDVQGQQDFQRVLFDTIDLEAMIPSDHLLRHTVQRFFNTAVSWGKVQWLIIAHHLLDEEDVLLLAGDEVVVTKSGKKTHGLDRFFSSLYSKAVPGICFLSLSLISVKRRCSYPVMMEQVVKEKGKVVLKR